MDKALEPGLVKLTWTSLMISSYVSRVYEALHDLELLMDRANDLVAFRIDAVLQEMSSMILCELPEEEPWSAEYFLEKTQVGTASLNSI